MRAYTYTYFIDDIPRYVGLGKLQRSGLRALSHFHNSKKGSHWLNVLHKAIREQRPIRVCIDFITDDYEAAKIEEKRLIAHYGRQDLGTGTLCNKTEGGDGTVGIVHTAEQRHRNSAARKGKSLSPEHRASIGEALRGRIVSDEHRLHLSEALIGKKIGPLSDDHKSKLSAANKGKPWSEARRIAHAINGGNTGQKRTPEQRANMAAGHARRRANGSK